jgi:nucleolar MIF4G domain-containing protein 1
MGERSDLGSDFTGELGASGFDFRAEGGDASTESDEEDYDEWMGFDHSSEEDEEPILPPEKPEEIHTVAPSARQDVKYVPPHLRKAAADLQGQPSESLVKLTKRLKGLLNRYVVDLPLMLALTMSSLSEQNISSILDGVEEAYHNYSRNGRCPPSTSLRSL